MSARTGTLAALAVIALSAAYIVLLTSLTSLLRAGLARTPFGQGETPELVLGILAVSFTIVALVVSTVVVTNAFALVTATRIREIALRRLLGASARRERRRIAAQGARLGLLGTAVGIAVGAGIALAVFAANAGDGGMLDGASAADLVDPGAIVPLVALIASTALAAWRGSAAVLDASPVQALGLATTQETGGLESTRLRPAAATLLLTGLVLLVVAAIGGMLTPLAVLVGLAGGTVLAVGILTGSNALLPRVTALIARALPRTGPAAAAAHALREHPARTSRAALGVVISVAIVTMFVVATASVATSQAIEYEGSADAVVVTEIMLVVLAVVGALTGVIAVISAIGLSTTVALSTRLRAREIATTRILGQNRGDAARAILIEGAVTSAAATLSGLAVGSVLGWVGAQSVLGSTLQSQLVTPVVPVLLVGVIAAVALVLTALSTIAPMRFVLADSPMRAFARA